MAAHPPQPGAVAVQRRALLAAGVLAWARRAAPGLAGTALSALVARPALAAPGVLLAREWPAGADPSPCLVSEKLDGVRALWDGQVLRFRSGRVVPAPPGWLAQLPAQPLDGELWLGRGRFEQLVGTVRRLQPDEASWRSVSYQVFELPAGTGLFAERAQALQRLCAGHGWAGLQAVAQQRVADAQALQQQLAQVLARGGEGLMLHRADAPLATGRGPWLFKHKPLHDAEAVVLSHLPGQGRLAGRMGALQVRTDAGVELAIGTGFSDAQRAQPPAIGQRITFSHQGYTGQGVPRFARYLRLAPAL